MKALISILAGVIAAAGVFYLDSLLINLMVVIPILFDH